jgi:hypothetical protein
MIFSLNGKRVVLSIPTILYFRYLSTYILRVQHDMQQRSDLMLSIGSNYTDKEASTRRLGRELNKMLSRSQYPNS